MTKRLYSTVAQAALIGLALMPVKPDISNAADKSALAINVFDISDSVATDR